MNPNDMVLAAARSSPVLAERVSHALQGRGKNELREYWATHAGFARVQPCVPAELKPVDVSEANLRAAVRRLDSRETDRIFAAMFGGKAEKKESIQLLMRVPESLPHFLAFFQRNRKVAEGAFLALADFVKGLSKEERKKALIRLHTADLFAIPEYFSLLDTLKQSAGPEDFVAKVVPYISKLRSTSTKECVASYQNYHRQIHGLKSLVGISLPPASIFRGVDLIFLDPVLVSKYDSQKGLQISERHWGILKLMSLAMAQDWKGFETVAGSFKSKLPPLTMAKICDEHGNRQLALKLLQEIKSREERDSALADVGGEVCEEGGSRVDSSVMLGLAAKK